MMENRREDHSLPERGCRELCPGAMTSLEEEGLLPTLHTPLTLRAKQPDGPSQENNKECCLKHARSISKEWQVNVSSLPRKWVDHLEPPQFSLSHPHPHTPEHNQPLSPSKGYCTQNNPALLAPYFSKGCDFHSILDVCKVINTVQISKGQQIPTNSNQWPQICLDIWLGFVPHVAFVCVLSE